MSTRLVVPDHDTTNAQGAPPSEANLSWNTIGAPGPRGPQGARGPAITIAGGNTLTISGGQVITVGGSHGVTINTPTITPNSKPIGTLKMALGGSPEASHVANLDSWRRCLDFLGKHFG